MKSNVKQIIAAILAILSLSTAYPTFVFAEDDSNVAVEQTVSEAIRFTGKQTLIPGQTYYIDKPFVIKGTYRIPAGVTIEIREGGKLSTNGEKANLIVYGDLTVAEGGTLNIMRGKLTAYDDAVIEVAGEMRVYKGAELHSECKMTFTDTSYVKSSGLFKVYKGGDLTVGGDFVLSKSAEFKTSAPVTVTEDGSFRNNGIATISTSGSIQNDGEIKGNIPEGKPVEGIPPVGNSADGDNTPAPAPAPAPLPVHNPSAEQSQTPSPAPTPEPEPTPTPAPVIPQHQDEADALIADPDFEKFEEHFPDESKALENANNNTLDSKYEALVNEVNDAVNTIVNPDPDDRGYIETDFTPESWEAFETDYNNLITNYDDNSNLIDKINFLDEAKDIQERLVYKGTPDNYDEISDILLTYDRSDWFYTDTMNAFDALKTAEDNLKMGADYDVDSADLATLCDAAYEAFVNALTANFAHYKTDNAAFNLFKTQTDVYLQSEYDYYIGISEEASPTIAEMTALMNAVNVERRTGVTVKIRTTPPDIDTYTDFYETRTDVTAASLSSGMEDFTEAYEAWTIESSEANSSALGHAYDYIENSIIDKYYALVSGISVYDNPTGVVYEPTSLAALKETFSSYSGINTTLLQRAELIALRDAVKFKVIPGGLTVADVEYLAGQTGLRAITSSFVEYEKEYTDWNNNFTDSSDFANRLAANVRDAYTAVQVEIGGIFAAKQDDYKELDPKIVYGYYTPESVAVFNENSFFDKLMTVDVTLDTMIEVVLHYDSEKSNLLPAPHPEFMIGEGNNMTEIFAIQETKWHDAASAYYDAYYVWDKERTPENAAAANLLWHELTDGIDGEFATAVTTAQGIIGQPDVYSALYREGLSGLIANIAESTYLEKISTTAALKNIGDPNNETYETLWSNMLSNSKYIAYLNSLGLSWTEEGDKAAIRAIVDGTNKEYLNHRDVSYTFANTFIGANNVVLYGSIPESSYAKYIIVEVFESTEQDGIRENESKWAYDYEELIWHALSGNNTNFAFALNRDNFHYTITVGTFNQETYISSYTELWTLPEGTWNLVN